MTNLIQRRNRHFERGSKASPFSNGTETLPVLTSFDPGEKLSNSPYPSNRKKLENMVLLGAAQASAPSLPFLICAIQFNAGVFNLGNFKTCGLQIPAFPSIATFRGEG